MALVNVSACKELCVKAKCCMAARLLVGIAFGCRFVHRRSTTCAGSVSMDGTIDTAREEGSHESVFVYGTLMAEEVVGCLLGRVPESRPATMEGVVRWFIRDEVFPALMFQGSGSTFNGSQLPGKVDGRLLEGLSARDLRALDYFEDDGYQRTSVQVHTTARSGAPEVVTTTAYIWPEELIDLVDVGRPWSYEGFRAHALESYLEDPVRICAADFEEEEKRCGRG